MLALRRLRITEVREGSWAQFEGRVSQKERYGVHII